MTDWEVIIEDDPSPELQQNSTHGNFSHFWRRWGLGLVSLGILFLGGLVLFQSQLNTRRDNLETDLTAFIFEEEAMRVAGEHERVTDFIDPNAPHSWKTAYRRTFDDAKLAEFYDITLEDVDFDGSCALVTVAVDNHQQIRNYCLINEGWRRTPVPIEYWGSQQSTIHLPNGATLLYFEPDAPFAQELATALSAFFDQLAAWQLGAEQGPRADFATLQLSIEPHELQRSLLTTQGSRIVINSPLLARPDNFLSTEVEVRLALAKLLLERVDPLLADAGLPGGPRIQRALHSVMALHLFGPDTIDTFRAQWRGAVTGQWESPFFVELEKVATYDRRQRADTSARLMADYIARLHGLDTLAAINKELANTTQWDQLLIKHLGLNTASLEQQVAVYAQAGFEAAQQAVPPATPALPITTTLFDRDREGERWLTTLPDQPHPIWLELADPLTFQTPSGESLPRACMIWNRSQTVEIQGHWLEEDYRLQVDQLTLLDVPPPSFAPIKTEPLAYLVSGSLDTPQALFILNQAEGILPLIGLNENMRLFPVPQPRGQPQRFLFTLQAPDCPRWWMVLYEPTTGLTQQWLAPPEANRWLWRPDVEDLIFVASQDEVEQFIYQSTDSLYPQRILTSKQSQPVLNLMGWNIDRQQLLLTRSWVGETHFSTFDMVTEIVTPLFRPRFQPARSRRLSSDGRWLAYLAGVKNFLGPPDTLDIFNLSQPQDPLLFQTAKNEGFGPPVWSQYLGQNRLAILSGPMNSEDRLDRKRLSILNFAADPPVLESMTEAAQNEYLGQPVFCSDGSLLYVAEQDGVYRLHKQAFQVRAKTLLTRNNPFYPIACP